MYHVSAQCVDERMINVHYYYYYVLTGGWEKGNSYTNLDLDYVHRRSNSSVPLWTFISQVLRE